MINKSEFTAWLEPESYGGVPAAIDLKPTWFRVSDRVGSDRAEFSAIGAEQALWDCMEWLGRKIHIFDPLGTDVWRGKITEVDLSVAGVNISLAYDSMYNRIQCLYTYDAPDGSPVVAATEWADSLFSQNTHGIRELLHSMTDTFEDDAIGKRDRLLDSFETPLGAPTVGATNSKATITASGVFSLNEWRYYQNLYGRFEHSYSPNVDLNVGWELSGTGFGFAMGKLHDYNTRLDNLSTGNQILVSGAAATKHDGQVRKVTGEPSDTEQQSLSATDIWSDPSDEIYTDNSNGWAYYGFRANEIVYADLPGMEGFWAIEAIQDDETPEWLDITNATIGSSNADKTALVTITQGASVELDDGTARTEFPQSLFAETLTFYGLGLEVEQIFTSNFTGEATLVSISASKRGTPTDTMTVAIYADSGGSRGSLLASSSISPANLLEVMQAVWVEFSTPASLVEGTVYHLVIGRSGATSDTNLYRVGCTTDNVLTPGSLLLKANTSWYTQTDMSLSFMVYATKDTVELMKDILDHSDQFSSGYVFDPALSGQREGIYFDGRTRALTILESLLEKGVSGGRRLIVKDDPGFRINITEEPARESSGKNDKIIWADGRITHASAGALPVGDLPYGEWVVIGDLPARASEVAGELSPFYVQEAELTLTDDSAPRLRPRTTTTSDKILLT